MFSMMTPSWNKGTQAVPVTSHFSSLLKDNIVNLLTTPASRYMFASVHASSVIWDIFILERGVPEMGNIQYIKHQQVQKYEAHK